MLRPTQFLKTAARLRAHRHRRTSNRRGLAFYRLRTEPLEERRMLAVFTVSNLDDAGAGSLREAIDLANAAAGADTIDFSVTGTIDLASGLPTITDELTITGPGAGMLTIDAGNGADNDPGTGDGYRIFSIDDGNAGNQIDVAISGLTLSGGDVFGGGAAILNRENLSLTSSTLSGNSASGGGGGIYNGGTATVTSSTLSGNSAAFGGGIYNRGTATLTSSTLSGNSASFYGGGIYNLGTATVSGSLVAGNTAVISGPDVQGTFSGTYNLIGDGTGMDGLVDGSDGNQVGSGVSPIDPLLGPLADNGGPTETHALLPGSPAFDAGDPSFTVPPDFDQRGTGYERVYGAGIDIGAYELLLADGNLDGTVNGLDYLLWAGTFGNDPADDPPGSPQNGDYNNDGVVNGLDYLLWAGQFGTGSAVVAVTPTSETASTEKLAAVDAVLEDDFDTGATRTDETLVRNWRHGIAFDAVFEDLAVKKNPRHRRR